MERKGFWILALLMAFALVLLLARQTAQANGLQVTNTNDDGPGSLRQAIEAANAAGGDSTIAFNVDAQLDPNCDSTTGVCVIQPTSPLLTLAAAGTTIDGYSQPGALQATETVSASLKIVIDGSLAGSSASGIVINSAGNVVRGLVINRFSENGIWLYGIYATDNVISGNYIGTDAKGTADLGNDKMGVLIDEVGTQNTIGGDEPAERNVISGNGEHGVHIFGDEPISTTVSGNYIGTDASGTTALANDKGGVYIHYSAQNTIGPGNVIAGDGQSGQCGVFIVGPNPASGNIIVGNHIGTDRRGTTALGLSRGINIMNGAKNNTVGGYTEAERNVISGNIMDGVRISGIHTKGNMVLGNYIGTDASGTTALGNGTGCFIGNGAQDNTIGSMVAGGGNVIAGNDMGVHLWASDTTSNTILGNYIGINAQDMDTLGNILAGVNVENGPRSNTIGPGNVIAYNGGYGGVWVQGGNTISNTITRNSIFANVMKGISLTDDAHGGIAPPVISDSTTGSVQIIGSACAGCTVEVFENGDDDGEGETYVGNTTATASGAFTLTISSLSKPYLTATASDLFSGTSEFSEVFAAGFKVYLPLVMRNH